MTTSKKKSKTAQKIIFSVRVFPRFHHAFKLEALKRKILMEDLLNFYQEAYEEKLERERLEKRAEKEGKHCQSCGQLVLNRG